MDINISNLIDDIFSLGINRKWFIDVDTNFQFNKVSDPFVYSIDYNREYCVIISPRQLRYYKENNPIVESDKVLSWIKERIIEYRPEYRDSRIKLYLTNNSDYIKDLQFIQL